jgi:serine/threonine-protein kinase RsbW/stage II sporulation protein AB (anti-sigma F factor)
VRTNARSGGIVATVMTLERTQGGPPFSLQLQATPESVATARRALAAYCAAHGAARETTDRVLLSVSEAVTNALVHAYRHVERPADERIELEASCDDASLHVIVRDFGCGMAPRLDSPGLGLGLPLIAASTTSVQIDAPPEGGRTEISMEFELREPVLD